MTIVANLTFLPSGGSTTLDVDAIKTWLTEHGPVQTKSEAQFSPGDPASLSLQSCHQTPHPVWEYRTHVVFPDGTTFDTAPKFAFTVADTPALDTVSPFTALGLEASYTVGADGSFVDDTPKEGRVAGRFGNSPFTEEHVITVDTVEVLLDEWSCGSSGAGPFTPN